MIECGDDITPEDVLRAILRTDGDGNYALAVNDLTASGDWISAADCQDGLTWKDIVLLIFNKETQAINIVDET